MTFVAVGANLEPELNIPRALELLLERVRGVATSTFYRTVAIGGGNQPHFLNGIWRIRATMPARELKFDVLRPIEAALGRVRSDDRHAPRPIDLDIVLFGDLVSREADLRIPDPDIRRRPFLAITLRELAPDLVLPDTGEALATLAPAAPTPDMEPQIELTRRLQGLIACAARPRPREIPLAPFFQRGDLKGDSPQ